MSRMVDWDKRLPEGFVMQIECMGIDTEPTCYELYLVIDKASLYKESKTLQEILLHDYSKGGIYYTLGCSYHGGAAMVRLANKIVKEAEKEDEQK